MIANQVKGTGFRGTLDYLLGKDDAQIIGGNMVGETPKELASEFSVSRALRPKLKHVVYHSSLSLPHDEHLSTSKWKEAADKYVQKMGFSGSQYVVVKHNDTKHDHIHIVASRVRLNGTVVSDSQDYKRSEKVVRGLEKHFGLTPTLSSHEVEKKALTKGELHKVLREQKPSIKMQLQTIIDSATEDRPDANTFAKRLAKQGITVIPNQSKTGHISGISFEINGEQMKGSDLGRSYSWSNLTKRKLKYGKNTIQNQPSDVLQSHGENKSRNNNGNYGKPTRQNVRRKFSKSTSRDYEKIDAFSEQGYETYRSSLIGYNPNERRDGQSSNELCIEDQQCSNENRIRKLQNSKSRKSLQATSRKSRSKQLHSSNEEQKNEFGIQRNVNRSDSWLEHLLDAGNDLINALFEIKEERENSKNRLKIKLKPKKVNERTVEKTLSKSKSREKKRTRSKGISFDF